METGNRMSRQTVKKIKESPATYPGLIARFPLRPLHDEVDYDNALEIADRSSAAPASPKSNT